MPESPYREAPSEKKDTRNVQKLTLYIHTVHCGVHEKEVVGYWDKYSDGKERICSAYYMVDVILTTAFQHGWISVEDDVIIPCHEIIKVEKGALSDFEIERRY